MSDPIRIRRTNELAHEIAQDAAISLIQSCGAHVTDRIGRLLWYELDFDDAYDGAALRRAIRYLALCGLLRRRSSNPKHFNIRWSR